MHDANDVNMDDDIITCISSDELDVEIIDETDALVDVDNGDSVFAFEMY